MSRRNGCGVLRPAGTCLLDIHERWLRGQALLLQMASKDWPAAEALVESLLADAPDFSPALSGLVQYRNIAHIALPGQLRDRGKHLETLRIAQRAVQLDPLDSRAQLSLAWTYLLLGRVNEVTLHAALAVDLNENDPWTLMAAAQILAYCGEYQRADRAGRDVARHHAGAKTGAKGLFGRDQVSLHRL